MRIDTSQILARLPGGIVPNGGFTYGPDGRPVEPIVEDEPWQHLLSGPGPERPTVDAHRDVVDARKRLERAARQTPAIAADVAKAEQQLDAVRPALAESQLQYDAGTGSADAVKRAAKPVSQAEDALRRALAVSQLHVRELASLEGELSSTRERIAAEMAAAERAAYCAEVQALDAALTAAAGAAERVQARWKQLPGSPSALHWPELLVRGYPLNPSRLDAWRAEAAPYLKKGAHE